MNQKEWRAQYKLYYLQSAYRLWQQVSGAGSCAASAGVTSVTHCHAVSHTVTPAVCHTLLSRAAVTRCCHTLLSHAAVTRGKLLLSSQINVLTANCSGRRYNAQLLRIIHLLNRLSGFISVTCPCVQHLPRDTCPGDDLQRCNRWLCAVLCTVPGSRKSGLLTKLIDMKTETSKSY